MNTFNRHAFVLMGRCNGDIIIKVGRTDDYSKRLEEISRNSHGGLEILNQMRMDFHYVTPDSTCSRTFLENVENIEHEMRTICRKRKLNNIVKSDWYNNNSASIEEMTSIYEEICEYLISEHTPLPNRSKTL
jgi:hypothetical protein